MQAIQTVFVPTRNLSAYLRLEAQASGGERLSPTTRHASLSDGLDHGCQPDPLDRADR